MRYDLALALTTLSIMSSPWLIDTWKYRKLENKNRSHHAWTPDITA
jgi:hypothetical protein